MVTLPHSAKSLLKILLAAKLVFVLTLLGSYQGGSISVLANRVEAGWFGNVAASAVTVTEETAKRSSVNLSAAIEERKELLTRKGSVRFIGDNGKAVNTWTELLKDHPEWVVFEVEWGVAKARVNAARIQRYLESHPVATLQSPVNCKVETVTPDKWKVNRADTKCVVRDGFVLNKADAALAMKKVLEEKLESADVALTKEAGTLTYKNADGTELVLQPIGTGKSNFTGSGLNRKANVRKALDKHVNNVVILPGEKLSFNKLLGGSVDLSNGWYMAYVIMNGGDLVSAPGGGICQSSTTVYRAALAAGLPINVRAPHSLYVHYYDAGSAGDTTTGVGLDATVFQNQQDFQFTNDTVNPIVIQAYHNGDDATVTLFGIQDGRKTNLAGPYFWKNTDSPLLGEKKLQKNEIAWVRQVVSADGTVNREVITSRYKLLPRKLADASITETSKTEEALVAAVPAIEVASVND